jgi:uncharacterized protein (TIGR03435 family)
VSEEPPRSARDPLPLPDNPDIAWLCQQAKRHLKQLRDGDPSAQLADAQFALAKEYGFSTWRALKAHVDTLTVDPVVTAALAQADRSAPAVKAAALLHIARVVNALDHAEAERVLERGIAAADVLREPDRTVILGQGVSLAATVSPERAIRLARSIEGDRIPGNHMSKALFDMMSHGHADAAVKYLTSGSADEDYPFDAALQAMGHSKDDATRLQILRSAIRAVRRQAESGSRDGRRSGPSRFPFLFTRWWRLLPADEAGAVVRDLVHVILGEPDQPTRASWNDARFSSSREHRLFEIFGPLRHLAPELAESLIEQNRQLAAAVERYPYGHESIEAAVHDTVTHQPAPQPVEQPDYISVGRRLVPIPDALRTDFKEAFDLALRLYAAEVDPEHPNDAPQECWPSTQEFRKILYKAGQHEGRPGARHLDRIPDQNLRLFAQIELAAALAGLPQVGGRSIFPGPYGFRQSMARSSAQRVDAPHSSPLPPIRHQSPTRKPDVPPSYDVRITPTRRAGTEGPAGGSGPDFWVIEGARLRPVLANLYDVLETRIDLPVSLESNRYDFRLVLPRNETREALIRLMREGIAKHFGVTREVRSMDVDVLTAPKGAIRAPETHQNDDIFEFGSIGFAQRSMGGPPQVPEGFMLMEIMNLHSVSPEASATVEENVRAMKNGLLRGLIGSGGRGVTISDICQSLTMAQLCEVFEGGLDRPLVDETHLSASYAINVRSEIVGRRRDFLGVVCDKLGLAISPGRRDVSMLVVRQA